MKTHKIMKLDQILNECKEGFTDPLQLYIELKKLSKKVSECIGEVESMAIDECEKHPEKSFEYKGAKITKSSTAALYNWSDDKVYTEYNEKIKERQSQLKLAVKNKEVIVDPETGEQIPVVSMKSPSKYVLRVQFINE